MILLLTPQLFFNLKITMYKATVNNQFHFDVDLNEILKDLDLIEIKEGTFHLISDNRSYNIWLVKTDMETKTMTININGTNYTVVLKDKMDLLLEKMGIQKEHHSKLSNLKAPMPGLVLDIKVEVGQEVKKGDPILVLEAMKMENVLKAAGDAIIKSIEVKTGQAVDKNEILIKF